MAFFLVKSNENTYPKGRALVQMYRVVPITKRGDKVILISRSHCANKTGELVCSTVVHCFRWQLVFSCTLVLKLLFNCIFVK